jgi:hypothetical protein
MTWRHDKVVEVARRPIEGHMINRLRSGIGKNAKMIGEGLTGEMQRLRSDLNCVASIFGTRFTVMIDISCPHGRISHGGKALQKVYLHKFEKYAILAREIKAEGDMPVEIIPVIVSSLGATHEHPLKDLSILIMCGENEMNRIGRNLSEAAIAGSLEIWREYVRKVMHNNDHQVREV